MPVPAFVEMLAGGPAAATFVPTDITGCQVWLDADDAATFTYSSGVLVSQWNDKSGNGRNVAQANTALQPSRNGTQNGRTTVVYAGDNLAGSNQSAAVNMTFFIVVKDTGGQFSDGYVRWGNVGFNRLEDVNHTWRLAKVGVANHDTGIAVGTAWTAWCWSIASSVGTLYKDGTSQYTSPNNAISTTAAAFTVGAGSAAAMNGELAEVILYNSTLGTTDRQTVEGYIRTKWGTP